MNKLTPAQKETWKPAHLPRHYYPGYVFIPKDGYFQARKIGLKPERVHIDPRFNKTRLLAGEFAQMAACTKLIHTAFCQDNGIKYKPRRLHGLLNTILQQDEVNVCGSRNLLKGDCSLLEEFNFNDQSSLEDVCSLEWDIDLQPETGEVMLQLPSFVPEYYFRPPAGISHARILLLSASFNFVQMNYTMATSKTSLIPMKRIHFPATVLRTKNQPQAGHLLITALGIKWYATGRDRSLLYPAAIPGPLTVVAVL